MPDWNFLCHLIPTSDTWSFSEPTQAAWFKLAQLGEMAYPNQAVALIADAEFLPSGEVVRLEAKLIYHSSESQILFIPPPLILTKTQRRIAVRRLARSRSYTPWELSIFESNTMALYGESSNVFKEAPITDSIPTTFSAIAYNAATAANAYQCLAPNPNRRKFKVTNNGTATVYGDLDAPSSATSRSFIVPPGNTYVDEDEYGGSVFIWSTVAAPQSCEIRSIV